MIYYNNGSRYEKLSNWIITHTDMLVAYNYILLFIFLQRVAFKILNAVIRVNVTLLKFHSLTFVDKENLQKQFKNAEGSF